MFRSEAIQNIWKRSKYITVFKEFIFIRCANIVTVLQCISFLNTFLRYLKILTLFGILLMSLFFFLCERYLENINLLITFLKNKVLVCKVFFQMQAVITHPTAQNSWLQVAGSKAICQSMSWAQPLRAGHAPLSASWAC